MIFNFYLIHAEQESMVDPLGVFDEACVTKHLRYAQHHQGHQDQW